MAAEFTSTKLNAESHLVLDQSLLRIPAELARRNFKVNQRLIERERDNVRASLKEAANSAISGSASRDDTLASLDSMITRMQNLKRRLETLHEEEELLHEQTKKRIAHLQDLYTIPNLMDVKYERWSRIRLNRLLVDYLLRQGFANSAQQLAQEQGIEDLVDLPVFVQCRRIADSLLRGETKEALAWCGENKSALKKGNNELEFELRLQQFIEMLRTGDPAKQIEARQHARKWLAPYQETKNAEILKASCLLAFKPNTPVEPYRSLYSPDRWIYLSELFTTTHHSLLSLPTRPLLHIALSAGLSALKTPSCHSAYASSSSNSRSASTSVCPICSTELNELARNVPYAHHTKSHVEHDAVVLPNNRVYGRQRLLELSGKAEGGEEREGAGTGPGGMQLPKGKVRCPTTGEIFDQSQMKKVFFM